LVIFLISGGGSALMPMPQKGITLEEMQNVTMNLLKSGAYIDEINIVRKHISQIKGGRMVLHAHPATLLCFVLSDVVGDSLTSIASGPTVPDPTTYNDAINVLKRYSIWQSASDSVKRCLIDGVDGKIPESLKPGDPKLEKVQNLILGSNRIALRDALEKARQLGFNSMILSTFIEGEARHIGTAIAGIAREIMASGFPLESPAVLLCGGETTVTVKGEGLGGRNQELALSAAFRLRGLEGVVIASVGTDGIDGPTDAAGAIVDGSTWNRSRDKGLKLELSLNDNDSYTFFNQLGDLIITGPTGTNVNDIMIIVVNS
jgi:glycerate 2-kinase